MITRKIVTIVIAAVVIFAALGAIILLNKPNQTSSIHYINQSGSTTMYEMANVWAASYEANNSNVQINITEPGSGVGIADLLDHTANIADSSRQMNAAELANASSQGMHIVELPVALDGITMVVNPYLYEHNVTTLTLEQLKGLYDGSITNWKILGGPNVNVTVYGRNSTSGTYTFFQQNVLDDQNYSKNMTEYPNYDQMIADLLNPANRGAIGFVGVGFANDLDIISLKENDTSKAYLPTRSNVESFNYPLSRYLYIDLGGKPTGSVLNYIEWIIDQQLGQTIVTSQGFYPISQNITNSDTSLIM
jgi:phosphate transport system substrate-binding protein